MKNKASLSQRLAMIGFRISYSEPDLPVSELSYFDYDIEETLIEAGYEAQNDFRLLSLLATWIKVHGDYVVVEKFFKKVKEFEKYKGRNPVNNLLAAQAASSGFHKWKKWIITSSQVREYPVKPSLLEGSIKFQGLNDNLAAYGVLIPKKFLRIREADVFTPEELARSNTQYRNRLFFGPSWRAEIVSAIENGLNNPSAISRTVGCSYEPAHRISREYLLAKKALAVA